jgi:hypothetical protein
MTKLCHGIYRITLSSEHFGQVRHVGREWHAEVRQTETGNLVRYAGIWPTRQAAIDELVSTI